ncbi:hypothetical protein L0P88_01045 [Muricauda sp. SCSIO 64092]|uniref:hypothetical protein n=1 Tax=Allomuricauda sp. SCSIO 64092 TaxID=2908842 RepID=UPI001FF1606F|nr:hypothetical protein [Muricauda sp. SCSIO 64092]UOY07151.1 hypothetical protein L0P88_01045 [Muricauda sp. SCSIO 64092]
MESYLKANPDEFQKFKNATANAPVVMLNLLRYKEIVMETGETGKEAYTAYLNAAAPFFKNVNAKVLFFGTPKHMLIGPTDEELWHAVLIVEYNAFSDFMGMAGAEGYPSHLRERALLDSRLIHCQSIQH